MKSKNRNELRELDIEGLKKKADELSGQIDNLVFDRQTKPEKNTRQIKNLRKEKAVVLTFAREKELLHDK